MSSPPNFTGSVAFKRVQKIIFWKLRCFPIHLWEKKKRHYFYDFQNLLNLTTRLIWILLLSYKTNTILKRRGHEQYFFCASVVNHTMNSVCQIHNTVTVCTFTICSDWTYWFLSGVQMIHFLIVSTLKP